MLLLGFSLSAWSQDSGLSAAPEPPPVPPPVESGEPLEPEITIVETEKGKVQQYRMNGQVYMVKVIPLAGAPYYLIDTDGDGELDSQADDIKSISVPKWVLFSW